MTANVLLLSSRLDLYLVDTFENVKGLWLDANRWFCISLVDGWWLGMDGCMEHGQIRGKVVC